MESNENWDAVVGPKQVHVVGRKNHGKTALTTDLISEMKRRGFKVGSVKHSSHVHLLEPPTKDSARHRGAGATPAAVLTPEVNALFLTDNPGSAGMDALTPLFRDCDVVIVEGFASVPQKYKIEVFRPRKGGEPLARKISDVRAVVTDLAAKPDVDVPCWDRHDVPGIADRIAEWLGL